RQIDRQGAVSLVVTVLSVALPLHARMSLFFFTDAATTGVYTLSLHDALPISMAGAPSPAREARALPRSAAALLFESPQLIRGAQDRKSTRLNSSHLGISYAVFCLKTKKRRPKRIPSCRCCAAPAVRTSRSAAI